MEIRHGHVRQDLPDEWWEEAGMAGFVPARATYRANPAPYPVERVIENLPSENESPRARQMATPPGLSRREKTRTGTESQLRI